MILILFLEFLSLIFKCHVLHKKLISAQKTFKKIRLQLSFSALASYPGTATAFPALRFPSTLCKAFGDFHGSDQLHFHTSSLSPQINAKRDVQWFLQYSSCHFFLLLKCCFPSLPPFAMLHSALVIRLAELLSTENCIKLFPEAQLNYMHNFLPSTTWRK